MPWNINILCLHYVCIVFAQRSNPERCFSARIFALILMCEEILRQGQFKVYERSNQLKPAYNVVTFAYHVSDTCKQKINSIFLNKMLAHILFRCYNFSIIFGFS